MLVEASSQFHPMEELLEEFCFGRLREPALYSVEVHLLQCELCRAKLEEVEEDLRLWKGGVATYKPRRFPSLRSILAEWVELPALLRPAPVLAAGLVLAVFGAVALTSRHPAAVSIELASLRGGENDGVSSGPSNRPLDLQMNATTLPPASAYRLELVNYAGRQVWAGDAKPEGVKLSAHVSSNLGAGLYWVRLYGQHAGTPETDLLREFALRLQ